jgi:hypothetical protein
MRATRNRRKHEENGDAGDVVSPSDATMPRAGDHRPVEIGACLAPIHTGCGLQATSFHNDGVSIESKNALILPALGNPLRAIGRK